MNLPKNKTVLARVLGRALLGAALLGGLSALGIDLQPIAPTATAQAAEDGHSSDSHSGGGHSGLPRGHSGGHESGGGEDHADSDDSHSDHAGGKGGAGHGGRSGMQGGHDTAHGGSAAVEDRVLGGRPVWAQEGIPEVELGHLNVGRAPGHVLARAEDEALSEYTAAMAQLYNLSAEVAAALLRTDYRNVARIDSPLQNLAMYKDVMTFGRTQLPDIDNNALDLAAIFLGSAADKNTPISADTVVAVGRILGLVDLGDAERATLAAKADAVRAGILAGHGDTPH